VSVPPNPAAASAAAPPYTADEVAAMLRLNRRTVIELAKRGELPAVRVGKLFRFPRAKTDALAAGEVAP